MYKLGKDKKYNLIFLNVMLDCDDRWMLINQHLR